MRLRDIFLMAQPPLLTQEEYRAQYYLPSMIRLSSRYAAR